MSGRTPQNSWADRSPPRLLRWAPWICVFVGLAGSAPLWWHGGGSWGHDWGFAQNAWQLRWQTLREYGQWPAHNPWEGGGLPVNPGLGYFSFTAPLTLLLGPLVGVRAMIAGFYVLGAYGWWRLGGKLLGEAPAPRILLAALGTLCPALAFHLAVGHVIFANFMVWPLIFACLLEARQDPWSGLKAGLLFALGFNELPYYLMQYGSVMMAIGWLAQFLQSDRAQRRMLGRFVALSLAGAVPFVIPQVVAIVAVARDYARVANTPVSFSAAQLFAWYAWPETELRDAVFVPALNGWWGNWEMACYLGWASLALFAYGLLQAPRWFHLAAAVCFVFSIGNLHSWEPMRWLMAVPGFSSLQTFHRLRLFTYLFFILGAVWGWDRVNRHLTDPVRSSRWSRWLGLSAALVMVVDVARVSVQVARRAHVDLALPAVVNHEGGRFYQQAVRRELPAVFDGWPADLMSYTRANIGIVREPAAIDPNFRLPNLVQTVDDPGYVGEFVQHGRAVSPIFWSPNRIVLRDLDPHEPVRVNFNRGSPWHNFGRPLFPDDAIVEFQKPFVVSPDARGEINLTYVLPGQVAAWWCTLAAFGLSVLFCLYLRQCETKRPT